MCIHIYDMYKYISYTKRLKIYFVVEEIKKLYVDFKTVYNF